MRSRVFLCFCVFVAPLQVWQSTSPDVFLLYFRTSITRSLLRGAGPRQHLHCGNKIASVLRYNLPGMDWPINEDWV